MTFLRREATHLRVAASTQPTRQLPSDLQRVVRMHHLQHLRIGIDDHKLHAADPTIREHAIYGIAASATDADDHQSCWGGENPLIFHCHSLSTPGRSY